MEKTPHWRDIRPQYLDTLTTREARRYSMLRHIQQKGVRVTGVKNEELTIVQELIISNHIIITGDNYVPTITGRAVKCFY
jgi:hypothetical protein